MIGFSFKNFVLQIIQGSIISIALIYLLEINLDSFLKIPDNLKTIIPILFISVSFVIGVMNDFIADIIEGLVIKSKIIKPPSYHLLEKGEIWGIKLAHHKKIYNDLLDIAESNSGGNKDNSANYIFQVAKNYAFRECRTYQKEQLESFFTLYIFSRNLALSLLIVFDLLLLSALFCPDQDPQWILLLILPVLILIAILSSYRYFLYYARILLGSTFKPREIIKEKSTK